MGIVNIPQVSKNNVEPQILIATYNCIVAPLLLLIIAYNAITIDSYGYCYIMYCLPQKIYLQIYIRYNMYISPHLHVCSERIILYICT